MDITKHFRMAIRVLVIGMALPFLLPMWLLMCGAALIMGIVSWAFTGKMDGADDSVLSEGVIKATFCAPVHLCKEIRGK